MFIAFSEGILSVTQYDEDTFLVSARRRETLEVVFDSIQLAGVAEEDRPNNLNITSDPLVEGFGVSTYISKPTFALFLQFELLNYLDYSHISDSASMRALDEMKEANLL
jgi:hypothetical protein